MYDMYKMKGAKASQSRQAKPAMEEVLGLGVCLLRRNEQDLIKPFTIVILPLQLHVHRTLILAMQ